MKNVKLSLLLLAGALTALPQAANAQKGMKGEGMEGGGMKGKMQAPVGGAMSPMHPRASRQVQEKAGLVKTGLRPVYPRDAECLEVKSFFGDQTRYDGSFQVKWANHGYHGGFDISAPIGTPLVAIADGEVVHKYVGGRLVGKQIFLRHAPEDTGLAVWVYSKYKHFDELPKLNIGDRVKKGQILGPSGDSGTAGGHFPVGYPHLHMSIYTSASPDYKTKERAVIPKNVLQLDPAALYKVPPVLDSHAAKALAEAEKDVPIPYKTTTGKVVPEGTRLIWPFMCKPR